jgi:hypothetical protein
MLHYTTEIDLAGIIIRDPVTTVTNLAIFAFGLGCYRRLTREDLEYPNKNWNYFFFLVGIASLIGVAVHGFSKYFPERIHYYLWWAMGIVQGAGMSLAQFGVGSNIFSNRKTLIGISSVVQFVLFAAGLLITGKFGIATIHIALCLIPIMIYYIFHGSKGKKAEMLVAAGIIVSVLTGVVHTFKLSFGQWFNHNDISHVLIIISLVLMYRGVKAGLYVRSGFISPA